MRILWLYGPPAVGKSVTAWQLLNAVAARDPATGLVDVDQLGMSSVEEAGDPEGHRLKGHALAAVAREFARSGVRTLVVSGVMGHELIRFYGEVLDPYEPVFVRLTAPDEELRRRLWSRDVPAEGWAGVEQRARSLDDAGLDHPVVAACPGTPVEVAARVLHEIGGALDHDPVSRGAMSSDSGPANDGGGQAILIGGTTAVGKSTVGWQAFKAARDPGQPTGFLDLRQLGFRGVDGGTLDHVLQANAANAVWQVFRAHGTQLLIMNGPVNRSADLAIYRTTLSDTPLRATRLLADRAALIERVHARIRGEMAPLAGDSLVGRPSGDAESIVDAAVRLQDQTALDTAFQTLDTTPLDPVQSARRVLSGH